MMKRLAALVFGVLFALGVTVGGGIRINLSSSMPKGFYQLTECGERARRQAEVGDLVAIETATVAGSGFAFFRDRGWLSTSGRPDDLLVKRIVAVGGDEVTDRDGRLCVDRTCLTERGSARVQTVRGVTLPSVTLPRRLHDEEVWLSSDHKKGIDSRYFGAIARTAIACRVEPLWIW